MSIENNSTLKIMTLGRQFELGMLYDYRTDKIIPNILLWGSDITPNTINCRSLSMQKCTVHKKDTFKEKGDLLGCGWANKLSNQPTPSRFAQFGQIMSRFAFNKIRKNKTTDFNTAVYNASELERISCNQIPVIFYIIVDTNLSYPVPFRQVERASLFPLK
ncbi:unnamed protein product [Adineta steineri]|uniref:Uncharacterized protein n=1 Tax=Adineta steineri TaxID=433720 RepID=A0A814FTY2_9BILA|nr:unnamed protein product [Adineta steineri]CAF0986755.1 unnamed protein product [Adineta steineri]CAF1030593.1 unnamed protein product [Adineta steineri]CAF3965371.1 unnamed protein product [Adineta steineri]CAF3984699.1 unnamed protein product [Adineta steineri]